jgi:nucleoside recognition membrane protein YjiH
MTSDTYYDSVMATRRVEERAKRIRREARIFADKFKAFKGIFFVTELNTVDLYEAMRLAIDLLERET